MFSWKVIRELLQTSAPGFPQLGETYAHLPAARCLRHAHCCSLLPEMTLVESLSAICKLLDFVPAIRRRIAQRIVGYFFLNPVEITTCPFLTGRDCLIYQDRFFGCRAYGLWSKGYYEKRAACDRQARVYLKQQWENLGVLLPREVIDFKLPYCRHVKPEGDAVIDDKGLLKVGDKIEALSKQFSPWHESFGKKYYSDLSFLLASLVFGASEAVQMKFTLVHDILATGNRQRLIQIVEELPDFCTELT